MQGLLNDWRRTHYAKDATPAIAGSDVTIMGWVHEIRDLGGIIFVIIRDVTGRVQITAPSKKVEAEILEDEVNIDVKFAAGTWFQDIKLKDIL